MPSYMLRDVDAELWRRFRARAAADGQGLKAIVLALVRWYADHGLPKHE